MAKKPHPRAKKAPREPAVVGTPVETSASTARNAPAAKGPSVVRPPRVAIVAGLRTPFARQSTALAGYTAQELGVAVVRELLARLDVPREEIGLCVFGQVVPSVHAPNVAREIVLGAGLDRRTDAYAVSRACATSFQAIASAAEAILAGRATIAIAGGTDSASDVPMMTSRPLAQALLRMSKAKSLGDRLRQLAGLAPRDWLPVPPAIKEPSTGLSMGESAELMAKGERVSRGEQDAFAHRSHVRAAAAWASGAFDDEVFALPGAGGPFRRDNTVRPSSDLAAYARLTPAFDRAHGTVTAGNSSPLTDGAAAVLLMREDVALALGHRPIGYLRSWAFAALDPAGAAPTADAPGSYMLLGPTHATPIALERAGVSLRDLALVDMHEAFAAQVLVNRKMFASKAYADRFLGGRPPTGEIDEERFNVNGGSIALGHPFAATGARMVTSTLRELARRGGGLALTTACAAGGLGASFVLETE